MLMIVASRAGLGVDITGDADAVISVFKFRWNAGACGATGCFDVVAPGASTGGAALAAFRALRVAFWGDAVIVRLIPVAAPLVDVIANVVKTEAVRRETAHWLGAIFPSLPIVRQRLWRFVGPGGEGAFCSPAGSAFP